MHDLSSLSPKQLGKRKNTLLRYKEIIDIYRKYEPLEIPTTVIWRKYIYPRFYVSKRTLYNALETPVERDLKRIAELENNH